ncbi:uncharacterized protein [Populus alba]|uniref:uncharacterized protein n=1 Tax=Populus alba TaxID=43335 RepID=UPI003CC75331
MMDNPDAVMKSMASVYSFGKGEDIILCSPFVCRKKLTTLFFMQPFMSSRTTEIDPKQKINGDLYCALMKGNTKSVADLCLKLQDHALHVITVTDDTVLHMATYAKEASLVEQLLDELPDHHLDKLTRQNGVGNTILHETATSNHTVAIARKLLKKAPGLLGMRNHNGETALFRAARYGKTDMFDFLATRVSGYDESGLQFYVQRSDKTTILHMAILSLHFGKHCQL